MPHDPDPTAAERLCRRCGLCCSGAVLSGSRLEASEVAFAEKHGLRVIQTERGPSFAHPSPLLFDRSCSAYAERPRSCRNFRCRTLRALEDGGVTEAEAHERMSELRQRVDSIESRLGVDDRNALWWAAGLLGDPDTTDAQRAELSQLVDVVLPDLIDLRRMTNDWIASPDDLSEWSRR